jgi:hypothetical protein
MITPKSSIYVFVAALSIATAACQPNEGPAERAGQQIDNAAERAGDQIERAGDKVKEAANR